MIKVNKVIKPVREKIKLPEKIRLFSDEASSKIRLNTQLFTILFYTDDMVLTCGFGKYIGKQKPEGDSVYDWDTPAKYKDSEYDAVKLIPNGEIVYSCESLLVKDDNKLKDFLKNKQQRYMNIAVYRFIHILGITNGKYGITSTLNSFHK